MRTMGRFVRVSKVVLSVAGVVLLLLVLAACGGAATVPGATSVHDFDQGQCTLITTSGQPAYTEPGPDKIPVGVSLPGEAAVSRAATFSDGSLWYLKADGVWFKATGADYETRGDCTV